MIPRTGRIAFTYPDFRHYMAARVLTTMASEMQALAVGWQVYGLTHRPLDLGLVGLAQFLPGVLLFPVTGHAADRFPRSRILAACCAGASLCSALLAALTLRGLAFVWPIYTVILLNGVVRAFSNPAAQAFLPLLVTEEHFPNAVAWNSSIFQVSMIGGPVAGGVLYGWTGSPVPVYVCAAAGLLAALFFIARIRPRAVVRLNGAPVGLMLEGLRYLWRNKLILGAVSLDMFGVLLGGAVALLPVYAREILRIGAYGLGLLRAAPAAGAVLTAVAVAHRPLRRRAGATMLWCVFGFGAATIVFGVSRNVALSLAALVALGACDMVSIIVRHTLVQLGTPDEMRGRVSAVNMVFVGTSNEVGQFESGITAQWFGTVPAVVLGGLGTIVIVALWAWWFPELREVDELAPQPPRAAV